MKKGLGAKLKLFSKKPVFFFNVPITIHGVRDRWKERASRNSIENDTRKAFELEGSHTGEMASA